MLTTRNQIRQKSLKLITHHHIA